MAPPARPRESAIAPQNTPLTDDPSHASSDSAPGPVRATVKAATPRTRLYLIATARVEEPLFDVHTHGSHEHDGKDDRGRHWGEQPESEKKPTAGLDEACPQRVAATRLEAEHRQAVARGLQPLTTEPTEQFLCPMRRERQPDRRSQEKESHIHASPRSVIVYDWIVHT